jgi:hypothetical protein
MAWKALGKILNSATANSPEKNVPKSWCNPDRISKNVEFPAQGESHPQDLPW